VVEVLLTATLEALTFKETMVLHQHLAQLVQLVAVVVGATQLQIMLVVLEVLVVELQLPVVVTGQVDQVLLVREIKVETLTMPHQIKLVVVVVELALQELTEIIIVVVKVVMALHLQ
jgi:hypothetical protein